MVLEGDVATPTARLASRGITLDAETAQALARIDAVTRRGLSRDPADRYATARDMAQALEKAVRRATPSEVAAWVQEKVGDQLAERSRTFAQAVMQAV